MKVTFSPALIFALAAASQSASRHQINSAQVLTTGINNHRRVNECDINIARDVSCSTPRSYLVQGGKSDMLSRKFRILSVVKGGEAYWLSRPASARATDGRSTEPPGRMETGLASQAARLRLCVVKPRRVERNVMGKSFVGGIVPPCGGCGGPCDWRSGHGGTAHLAAAYTGHAGSARSGRNAGRRAVWCRRMVSTFDHAGRWQPGEYAPGHVAVVASNTAETRARCCSCRMTATRAPCPGNIPVWASGPTRTRGPCCRCRTTVDGAVRAGTPLRHWFLRT